MTAKRKFRRKRNTKHYDVEMIRDFFDQLRWEYAISHFEATHEPGVINPELVDQLSRYMCKYSTVGLKAAVIGDPGEPSEEAVEQMSTKVRREIADRAKRVLAALDTLESAIDEALTCAAQPDVFFAKKIRMTDDPGERCPHE